MKTPSITILSFCAMIVFAACNNPKNSTASSDSTSAKTEVAPSTTPVTITGKKWKLIELMGKPVADTINGKEPFIMLNNTDSSYSASGGCNGLGGKFELNEQTMRIKFEQGMSTMMACADMNIENELKKVLTDADNYSVNDTTMSLNKARMAPLARFKVVQ